MRQYGVGTLVVADLSNLFAIAYVYVVNEGLLPLGTHLDELDFNCTAKRYKIDSTEFGAVLRPGLAYFDDDFAHFCCFVDCIPLFATSHELKGAPNYLHRHSFIHYS